jgi:hypothetical protein
VGVTVQRRSRVPSRRAGLSRERHTAPGWAA